jgi:hypothetical protein
MQNNDPNTNKIEEIKYRPVDNTSIYLFMPCCGNLIHMNIHQPAMSKCPFCERAWRTENNCNLLECMKNIQATEQKHGRLLTLPSLYYKYKNGVPPKESPFIKRNRDQYNKERQLHTQNPSPTIQHQYSTDNNNMTPYYQNNIFPNQPPNPLAQIYSSIPPSPSPSISVPFSPMHSQSTALYQQVNPQPQPQWIQYQQQSYLYDNSDENYEDNRKKYDSRGYDYIKNRNQKDRQYHPYNNSNNIERKNNNNKTTAVYNRNIKDPRIEDKEIERNNERYQDKRKDSSPAVNKKDSNYVIDKQSSNFNNQNDDITSNSDNNDPRNRRKDQIEYFSDSDNIPNTSENPNKKQKEDSLHISSTDLKKTLTPTSEFIEQLDLNETPDIDSNNNNNNSNHNPRNKKTIICKVCKCEFTNDSIDIQDRYKSFGYCQQECFADAVNNRNRLNINNKHNNQ